MTARCQPSIEDLCFGLRHRAAELGSKYQTDIDFFRSCADRLAELEEESSEARQLAAENFRRAKKSESRVGVLEGALRQIRDFPYVGRQAEQARVGIARATLDEPKAGS